MYRDVYSFGQDTAPPAASESNGPQRAKRRVPEGVPEGQPAGSHPSDASSPVPPSAPKRFGAPTPPWSRIATYSSASTNNTDPNIKELVKLTSRLAPQTEQRVRAHIKLYQFCVLFTANDDENGSYGSYYKDLLFKVASKYREVGKAHPRQPHPHGPNISTVVWSHFRVALQQQLDNIRTKTDLTQEDTDHLDDFEAFIRLTGDDTFCSVATFVPLGSRNYAPREAQRFILKFDPTTRYGRESHESLASLVLNKQSYLPGFVVEHDRGPPSQLVKQIQQLTGDG